MAANLPELYKNKNVGQTGERDVLYSPNATQIRIHEKNKNKTSQSYLYNSDSHCVDKSESFELSSKSCSTNK